VPEAQRQACAPARGFCDKDRWGRERWFAPHDDRPVLSGLSIGSPFFGLNLIARWLGVDAKRWFALLRGVLPLAAHRKDLDIY
jgi:hypothetical protein